MSYLELSLLSLRQDHAPRPKSFCSCGPLTLARLPALSEGERSNVRFKGTGESGVAGTKSLSQGADSKGAGETDDIAAVGKFLTVLEAFGW